MEGEKGRGGQKGIRKYGDKRKREQEEIEVVTERKGERGRVKEEKG